MTATLFASQASKRGRPRRFASAAEKQRAYRQNKKVKLEQAIAEVERLAEIDRIAKTARDDGPFLMTDAEHGKGLLVTGGYDTEKINAVMGAAERDNRSPEDVRINASGSGRRVAPEGHAPAGAGDANNDEEVEAAQAEFQYDKSETDYTFLNRKADRKALGKPSKRLKRKDLIRSVVKLFCEKHQVPEPVAYDSRKGLWTLECGVVRSLCVKCGASYRARINRPPCDCDRREIVTEPVKPESWAAAAATL